MDLRTYYARHGLEGERALASAAKVNPRYLYQARTGRRHLTLPFMLRLIEASGFELTLPALIQEALGRRLPPRYFDGAQPAAR